MSFAAAQLAASNRVLASQSPLDREAAKASGLPAITYNKFKDWGQRNWITVKQLWKKPYMVWWKILTYLIIISLIIIAVLFGTKTIQGFENPNTADEAMNASKLVDQLIVNNKVTHDNNNDYKLINLQPVCFKQAAYLGNNLFDSDLGILEQMRLGSRFFFLQIDYFESDLEKDAFGKSYEPVLIWKQNNRNLSSKNSASLKATFQSILNHYTNSSIPFYTYPLVIMLHFVRLPYALSDIDKYDAYIKKVSDALKIFKDATITGYGGAKKEPDLFNNTFSEFNGKIIIGTNIETTVHNNKLDLDKIVHFRYYVNKEYVNIKNLEESDMVDVTALSSDNSANAYIYNAKTLLNMNDTSQSTFTGLHMNKFVIVKPDNDKTLTKEEVDRLLNKFKVNVVLHDYFSDNLEGAKTVFNLYNNSCYKIKSTS